MKDFLMENPDLRSFYEDVFLYVPESATPPATTSTTLRQGCTKDMDTTSLGATTHTAPKHSSDQFHVHSYGTENSKEIKSSDTPFNPMYEVEETAALFPGDILMTYEPHNTSWGSTATSQPVHTLASLPLDAGSFTEAGSREPDCIPPETIIQQGLHLMPWEPMDNDQLLFYHPIANLNHTDSVNSLSQPTNLQEQWQTANMLPSEPCHPNLQQFRTVEHTQHNNSLPFLEQLPVGPSRLAIEELPLKLSDHANGDESSKGGLHLNHPESTGTGMSTAKDGHMGIPVAQGETTDTLPSIDLQPWRADVVLPVNAQFSARQTLTRPLRAQPQLHEQPYE